MIKECLLLGALSWAAALVCTTSPNLAQAQNPAQPQRDDAVHSDGADPINATPIQREQAQNRFVRGKELYDEGDIEAALREFEASRAIVASPNARLYRARCLQKLGRLVEAYSEFGRTMVEALELSRMEARYARTVDAATSERKQLEDQLSFVNVTVHHARAETKLFVNGEEIRRTGWSEPAPAAPGLVEVRLTSPGVSTQVKTVELAPAKSQSLTFELAPQSAATTAEPKTTTRHDSDAVEQPKSATNMPQADEATLRPYFYIAAATAAVGIGAFTVFGLMSKSEYDALEQNCPSGQCAAGYGEQIERGKSQQTWANVGLAVGAVGLAAAATFYLLEPEPQESGPSVAISVVPGSVALRGRL